MGDIVNKTCSKCDTRKPLQDFHKRKSSIDGHTGQCKECIRAYHRVYSVLQRSMNREKYRAKSKKWKSENREIVNKYNSKWYKEKRKDPEFLKKEREANRKRYSDNIEKERARSRLKGIRDSKFNQEREKKKYHTDKKYNLTIKLRKRIQMAISAQSTKKSGRTIELLGCSIEKVRIHLEKQFLPGMTWKNHSLKGWHIDHIKPCASFDLRNPKQQKQCFHYTNLQPLWAIDNLEKGAKIE